MSHPSSPLANAAADLATLTSAVAELSLVSEAAVGAPPAEGSSSSVVSLLHRDALLSVFSLLQLDELRQCDFTCHQWHSAAQAEANGRTVREQAREKQSLYDQAHLDELWAQMEDDSVTVMQGAATRLRHLLTAADRVVAVMHAMGPARLKQLVNWMDQSDDRPALQHEYLWACLNCAASPRTDLLVEQGAIPVMVRLLRSPHVSIREQALWACANVACDARVEFRDELLARGALTHVLEFGRDPQSGRIGALSDAAWVCSTLFRKNPQPDFDECAPPIIQMLTGLMLRNEPTLLTHVCDAFANLCRDSTNDNRQIEEVVSTPGVAERIVELLDSDTAKLQKAALSAVSHILSGTVSQAQCLIDVGVLPALKRMLSSPIVATRKTACFSLANLMGNTQAQTVAAFEAGVLEPICHLLQSDVADVQYECAFVVSNAVNVADKDSRIARWLVAHGAVLSSLCACLPAYDADAAKVALLAIRQILRVGRKDAIASRGPGAPKLAGKADPLNAHAAVLIKCGGWSAIEPFLQHVRFDISQIAHEIMAYRCD